MKWKKKGIQMRSGIDYENIIKACDSRIWWKILNTRMVMTDYDSSNTWNPLMRTTRYELKNASHQLIINLQNYLLSCACHGVLSIIMIFLSNDRFSSTRSYHRLQTISSSISFSLSFIIFSLFHSFFLFLWVLNRLMDIFS